MGRFAHWSHFIGNWNLMGDTIFVQIIREGNISLNTGIESKSLLGKRNDDFGFRFLIINSSSDKLELKLLDRFVYSKLVLKDSRKRYYYGGMGNEGIEVGESLKFKRPEKRYYWLGRNKQI